jgi:hypothetical protein
MPIESGQTAAGAQTAASPSPTPTPTPTPTSTASTGGVVTIPEAQYQEFLSAKMEVLRFQHEREQEARDRAQKDAETAIEQGRLRDGIEQLRAQKQRELDELKTALSNTENVAKRSVLDRDLSTSLAEHPLVSGAMGQLMSLMTPNLQVVNENGVFKTQTPTFQDVRSFVKDQLGKEEYSHFLKPTSTGGTGGATGAHLSSPTPGAAGNQQAVPQQLGVAAVLDTISRINEQKEMYKDIPATVNPRAGFGGFKSIG